MDYPSSMPDEKKAVWTHSDIFRGDKNFLLRPFLHYDYTLGMHTHEFYELNVVKSGKGAHYFCDNVFELSAGDVFVIPSNMKHAYYSAQNLDVYHVLIHDYYFIRYKNELSALEGFDTLFHINPKLREQAGLPLFLRLDCGQYDEIRDFMDFLIAFHLAHTDSNGFISVNNLALHLFSRLSSFSANGIASDPGKMIVKSLEHIYSGFDGPLSVDVLAEELHISRGAYYAMFKKFTGTTPSEFVIGCRINKAKTLLISTGLTVTEIANQTGFYDGAHFTRLFRSRMKLTPTEYREKNRKILNLK